MLVWAFIYLFVDSILVDSIVVDSDLFISVYMLIVMSIDFSSVSYYYNLVIFFWIKAVLFV